MRFFLILPIAIVFTSVISCKETDENSQDQHGSVKYQIKVGDKTLFLELALTSDRREKGLMYKDRLGDAEGMLFVFETPQPMRFWMKNTRIPLDVGYFGTNGRLKEIHRGKPFDLTGMPSRSQSLQFVIELNAGEYQRLGIRIGDKIDLKALVNAIAQSGQVLSRYGLHDSER